ncbi:MAG: symmetrical bis(5'-nucleosyl)-tetraphosphatase [Uliginosibacterium sp.]|nr:symmetrical bis(5'-nucleosyl)-tetraphosphatase [Uliginosibacterium sp.]MBK9614390.1 symmetrical bis(5'-nucleosyl)-tetraphosphatase [Uliginosibacterium sp.]
MADYAIGDLQGCLQPFRALLEEIDFDRRNDRVWLVGDLINRGPDSLETLRYVKAMGRAANVVLGNHDLFFLAVAAGASQRLSTADTITPILDARDGPELIDWLRHQPLMFVEGAYAMVHAGLLPEWTISEARALACEIEQALQSDNWRDFLVHLFGNKPEGWHPALTGWDRYRVVINAMTRMRYLTQDGRIDLKAKGPLDSAPAGLVAWFSAEAPRWASHTILCGHWSALGYRDMGRVIALDSGCVWGQTLTAVRLQDRQVFRAECPKVASLEGND